MYGGDTDTSALPVYSPQRTRHGNAERGLEPSEQMGEQDQADTTPVVTMPKPKPKPKASLSEGLRSKQRGSDLSPSRRPSPTKLDTKATTLPVSDSPVRASAETADVPAPEPAPPQAPSQSSENLSPQLTL